MILHKWPSFSCEVEMETPSDQYYKNQGYLQCVKCKNWISPLAYTEQLDVLGLCDDCFLNDEEDEEELEQK